MQLETLKKKYGGQWSENTDLFAFTWLHLKNTYAKLLWEPEDLQSVCNFIKDNICKYSIIGNGSNTLLGNIYDLLIVTKQLNKIEFIENEVIAEAGVLNYHLVSSCFKRNLGGLEFLHTIPGTIGGAICINAGAHGDEISNYITWVECIDKSDGTFKRFNLDEIQFGYRFSSLSEKYFISRAGIKIKEINPEEVREIIDKNCKYVEAKQPRHNTLGSTFKNMKDKAAWEIISLLPE
jgi:UDP-N-acetylmuramate dehydrogenase